MKTLLYLHGFLSSPRSSKAKLTCDWLCNHHADDINYLCPQISSNPHIAINQLNELMAAFSDHTIGLVGSSLGGFWAAYLSENYHTKAVLINPAVAPHTRFSHFLNTPLKSYYGDEITTLTNEDLAVLADTDIDPISNPSRFKVLLQTGDETLDYRMAQKRYCDAHLQIEEGGNHSFVGYETHLPNIVSFLFS